MSEETTKKYGNTVHFPGMTQNTWHTGWKSRPPKG